MGWPDGGTWITPGTTPCESRSPLRCFLRLSSGPLQAKTHPVAVGGERPVRFPECGLRVGNEIVVFRTGQHAHDRRVLLRAVERPAGGLHGNGIAADVGGVRCVGRQHGQPVAVFQRAPFETTKAGFQIGAARAHHLGHIDAAGHAEIRTHPALRHAQCQHLPALHGDGAPSMHRCAVERGAAIGARQRDQAIGVEAQRGVAQRELDARRIAAVANQAVAHIQRQRIQRARRAHAKTAIAGAAQVLHGRQHAGPHDLDHGLGFRTHARTFEATKRMRSPGASSVGGLRCGMKSAASVRPSSCQPPGDAAG